VADVAAPNIDEPTIRLFVWSLSE